MPEFVANSTISEVAEKAGCSEATFVRLAKRLGYRGYPELRESLLREDSEEIASVIGVSADDDVKSITRSVINASILSLRDSLDSIDYAQLERIVDAMESAGRILFSTAGDANIVAITGVQKLLRIGKPVGYNADFDAQLIALSQMHLGDVLICVSHSGRTKTVCDLAKIAKSRGILVVALTSFPQAPLARLSDITLLTVSFTRDIMGEIITKRVPALCIIDVIYICLLMRMPESKLDILDMANKLLRKNKL